MNLFHQFIIEAHCANRICMTRLVNALTPNQCRACVRRVLSCVYVD